MFLGFMKSKGHIEVSNASLVPVNDPTVLFTTAGMHPLVPYLLGQPHASGTRITNSQKCVRTNDIEEVGDTTHLTFFEMLGYWSLGDYFKDEALRMSFEFYTSTNYIGFDPKRMYVTVFEGNEDAGIDETSITTWKDIFTRTGIDAEVWNRENFNQQNLRIFPLNKKENWWGPAGQTGPCGPDSEMFYWRGEGQPDFTKYVPWDDSGMFIEVGNDVFMEFNKNKEGKFEQLKSKNVDFGGGLERTTAIHNFRDGNGVFAMKYSVYDIDIFQKIIAKIEEISGKKYNPSEEIDDQTRAFRVVAEHSRSATFILADGIRPANKDQGYILRRLIRRMVRHGKKLGIEQNFTKDLAMCVIETMSDYYTHLKENINFIVNEIEKEEIKFNETLKSGLNELEKLSSIDGSKAFYIYETYGFPVEMILEELHSDKNKYRLLINNSDKKVKFINSEILKNKRREFSGSDQNKTWREANEYDFREINRCFTDEFNKEFEKHKEESRSGAEQKFKGGLADASKETTNLHTAHHLLLAAMQKLINPEIKQRGSNITAERLRMDFNFDRKLTEEEVKRIEDLVNQVITDGLSVLRLEMPKTEAEKIGAQMEFGQKYPEIVSIYVVGNNVGKEIFRLHSTSESNEFTFKNTDNIFSIEFCGGPHVSNTSELGEGGKEFKIIGQESVGAGLRRVKAALV